MDFEEQLEKAEKLTSPSLVGSSLRSADDSKHNNYIHPEKYKDTVDYKKGKVYKEGLSNKYIEASLDDLMSEGALLGSEENFETLLDDKGNVKDDARYVSGKSSEEETEEETRDKQESEDVTSGEAVSCADSNIGVESNDEQHIPTGERSVLDSSFEGTKIDDRDTNCKLIYQQSDYSTPNLSDYQLTHDIKDHNEFMSTVQSYDILRLPQSVSNYKEANDKESSTSSGKSNITRGSSRGLKESDDGSVSLPLVSTDSLHTPYFQRDSTNVRSQSKSRFAQRDLPSSRICSTPHLARGDSYKNTISHEPSKYELPPDFAASQSELDEEVDSPRRSRQSKPTMGESIAAAERQEAEMSREPSLVTTGDYTNFDVDRPSREPLSDSYNRSSSSTNYLRSISRSRSRARHSDMDEKNDADPGSLVQEGALISDDPYSTIGGLDTMMEEVLNVDDKSNDDAAGKDSKNDASHESPTSASPSEEQKGSEQNEGPKEENNSVELQKGIDENVNQDNSAAALSADTQQKPNLEDKTGSTQKETEEKLISENMPAELEEEARELLSLKSKDATLRSKEGENDEPSISEARQGDNEGQDEKKVDNVAKHPEDDLDDIDISPEELHAYLKSQPVYIFTSLAGGYQIVHRANRLATILQANGIEFTLKDLGTDENAKKLWKRQANGKTLPGVVRGDDFVGNWQDIDAANEDYKVHEIIYENL